MNILFTNVGRRTYLIDYVLDLIKDGFDLKIFVSDTSENTAAFWVNKRVSKFVTPRVSDGRDKYIQELFLICATNKIDIVFPLMDFEIPLLSKNKDKFDRIGTNIIISSYELVTSLLDKRETEKLCLLHGINYPKSWYSLRNFSGEFPVILKRINGSGSVGLKIIDSFKDLNEFEEGRDFLQQLIIGKEYGIDILNDLNGNYIHCCVKEKILMRSGETDKAKVIDNVKYMNIAKKISNSFKHIGNLDADFIEDGDGNVFFIDFNPRFGGGYPFTHSAGCNYLRIIIELVKNIEPSIPNKINKIIGMKGIKMYYRWENK